MRKVILFALVGIALSIASYGVYETQSRKQTMSDILLANIEAISQYEVYDRYDCDLQTFDCKIKITQSVWNVLVSRNPSLDGKYDGSTIDLTDLTLRCLYGKGNDQCQQNILCNDVARQFGILNY